MAIKALLFGNNAFYPTLKLFYEQEVKKGNLEIVGHAVLEDGTIRVQTPGGGVNFRL